ncbi:MAG: tetratricopeptide repeat protein [Candidatus Peribacteria bacterium]|nr:MAG: tetratricopeptide repeat protein [Candidatus Peribacteria bacterium]
MIENFTLVHAELAIVGIIVLLVVIQLMLRFVAWMHRLQDRMIVKKKLKIKEQRKQEKQAQHSKSYDDESEDVLEKFAGLVKPDGDDDNFSEQTTMQEELLIASIDIDEDVTPEQQETPTPEKADITLEQKRIFKHQDDLDKLRTEALRAKEKGQIDIYEKKLIEGLSLEPEYPEFLTLLADHYFHTNHYKRALSLLKRLLDSDKTNHRAMRQMGEIYLSHGDIKTAEIMIEQAVKYQQNNPRYLYSLVDIKYNTDKVDDAIYLMERILKLRPTNVEYLVATAMLYEQKEDFDRARRYYATILEYDPDNHTAKHKLKEL